MDKTNRALIGVEDNAEAIRALRSRVNDNAEALKELTDGKINITVVDAKYDSSTGVGTFGKFVFLGTVIAMFECGNVTRTFALNNSTIGTGVGSFMYVVKDLNVGEFKFRPYDPAMRLVLIGDSVIKV